MPFGRLTTARLVTGSALCGALLFPLTLTPSPAHADVYHAVAAGETLSSVAAKYQISVDTLRTANNLKDMPENAMLGSMLLRVPSAGDNKAVINLPSAPSVVSAKETNSFGGANFGTASSPGSGSGSITRSVVETVRQGDTWESIAARYRAAGNDVTADTLRKRNNYAEVPTPGQTVLVPLGQIAYTAPAPRYAPRTSVTASAQTNPFAAPANAVSATSPITPSNAGSRVLDGGVVASSELDLPFAKATETTAPVYRPPGSAAPVVRGNLPYRGGYGEMTRGNDVRVLGQGEEATAPPSPTIRGARDSSSRIAKVAKVAENGAQIRRLPQSSAVTLYRCPVGTQLAVLQEKDGWSAILMSDRSTGWIPGHYLRTTGQTVDISTQIVTNPGPGGAASYSGNYGRENPMVAQALTWLGTPYHYGGTSRRGIDCSSLVQHSFAACGYSLPRTAAQQATVGAPVDPANLRSGDRLYFSASGTRIDHTGLYMGDGLFVHASGSGRQVMVSNLFEPRNWNIFVGARR